MLGIDLGTAAKLIVLTVLAMGIAGSIAEGDEWKEFYSHLSLKLLLLGFATIVAVVIAWGMLVENIPGMSLSWLNLFSSDGTNAINFGSDIKYVGVLFFLLLLFGLPRLAVIEEEAFREVTESWGDGIVRSIGFGLVHMIMGVPLGGGLALSIAGLVFTYQYFRGGVDLSARTHFHYNLIIVLALLIAAIAYFVGIER
jgi:hypothetical protein